VLHGCNPVAARTLLLSLAAYPSPARLPSRLTRVPAAKDPAASALADLAPPAKYEVPPGIRALVQIPGRDSPGADSYLSNPREARAIAEPDYKQKLAAAVAGALLFTDNVAGHAVTNAPNHSS